MILCAHERKLLVSSKIVYALLVHCAKLKLSDVLLAYFNSALKKESNVRPKDNPRTFTCSICSITFETKDKVIEHYQSNHDQIHKNNSCTKCDFKSTRDGLRLHHNTFHLGIQLHAMNVNGIQTL